MAWTTPGTATAGSVLTASFWNTNVRDNTNELYGSIRRLGLVTRTSNYSISSLTVAGAADVFSSDITWTAESGVAYIIEFYCPILYTGNGATAESFAHLVDGSGNNLGALAYAGTGANQGSSQYVKMRYTPGAGSKSVNIRGRYIGVAGNLYAGNGGDGDYMPAYLAVYGPDIT